MRYRTLGITLVIGLASVAANAQPAGQPSSATGSGHVLGIGGPFRTFAFAAIERMDGQVTGEAQIVRHDTETALHITIDCLNVFDIINPVVGTVAVMSGFDTPASHNAPEGLYWTFAVIDRGEGARAVGDDFFSLATGAPSPSVQNCFNFGPIGITPIAQGNVQVR